VADFVRLGQRRVERHPAAAAQAAHAEERLPRHAGGSGHGPRGRVVRGVQRRDVEGEITPLFDTELLSPATPRWRQRRDVEGEITPLFDPNTELLRS
jgi:hypothetical protein